VLHRDIKPDNVLIGPDGVPKVVDFGIARMTGAERVAQQRLTVAKTLMGSAHYMAPEQMEDAAAVDHRADVYSLGVLFYELLTGKLPIGQFEPASTVAEGVPILADRLIRHALAAKPEQRVQTVAQFRTFLQRMLAPSAPPRSHVPHRRRQKKSAAPAVLAVGAVLTAIVIAIVALSNGKKDEQAVVAKTKEETRRERAVVTAPPKQRQPPKPVEKRTVPEPEVRVEPPRPPIETTPEVRVEPSPKVKVTPPAPEKTVPEPRHEPPPDPTEMYREALATLRPLWQKRQYAGALTKAKELAGAPPGIVEDAEALAAFWKAVEAGSSKLKPGDTIRAKGMPATVTKVEAGTIHVSAGPVQFALEFAELTDSDATALAEKTRPLTSGPDLLALALLHLEDEKPDAAKARAALALAEKAGVDTSRHEALLPAEEAAGPSAQKFGKWVSLFDGASMGKWEALREVPDGGKLGSVKLVKGAMAFDTMGTCALIKYTGDLPETNYEVAFQAMLVEGEKIGAFVFPVSGVYCTWYVQGYRGVYTGLEMIDERGYRGNATTRRIALPKGKWHAVRLRVTTAGIQAWVEGEQTLSFTGDRKRLSSTTFSRAIGSLGHYTNNSRVVLRSIRIRTLPEGSVEAGIAAEPKEAPSDGWVSLFDGKTLDGWERAGGEWTIREGCIGVSVGRSDAKFVYARESYRNFELECDVFNDGVGYRYGIFFWKTGKTLTHFSLSDQKNGITVATGGSLAPRNREALPIEGTMVTKLRTVESRKWYRLRVRYDGERLQCFINDRLVVENLRASPRNGYVGLGARRASRTLFRNIRIRRLPD
jgi:hypothetical protein